MFPLLRRTLVQALVVSLLMHAALLTSVVSLFPAMLDTPATTIHVIMGRGSLAGSASAAKADAPPATKPSPENVKTTSPDAAKILTHQSVVAPETPAVRAVPSVQPSVRDGSVLSPSSPALAGAVSGSAGTATAAPVREGASADDMRHYRLSLASAARRFKRYPALAKERGWEGTVDVAINVYTLSPVPDVVLVRSSGRSVLDEQALEMMLQAARVTALPEGLKGRDFGVLLPVKFSLDENQ